MAVAQTLRRQVMGAALAGVAAMIGCTASITFDPRTPASGGGQAASVADPSPKANPTTPQYLPDSIIDRSPSKAPAINVFGEFDRSPVASAGAVVVDTSLRQHTFGDDGCDVDVSIDPAGKRFAYAGARDGEHLNLYLQSLDGGPAAQLTSEDADSVQPCFSPDGKSVAFASNRDGAWHIYVVGTDGRGVTQVTDGASNDMHPSFSPDGSRIVYSSLASGSGGDQWDLCVLNLASRQKKSIGTGLFPSWSPRKGNGGDVIAFQKTRARGSRWFSLWTVQLANDEPSAATEIAVSSNAALVSPAWSPDGKRLAFATIVEPAQTRRGKPQGQQDIWTCDADGGHRIRITDGTATNLTPAWGVDNRVYFVSDRSGHERIWSLPARDRAGASPVKASPAGKVAEKATAANSSDEMDK